MAVRRVGELQPQDFGVVLGLLQAVAGRLVGGLGLDDGEGEIARVAQEVVDALRRLADEALADGNDAPVGDGALLGDGMGFVVPACGLELGDDVLSAGVGFGERHVFPSSEQIV